MSILLLIFASCFIFPRSIFILVTKDESLVSFDTSTIWIVIQIQRTSLSSMILMIFLLPWLACTQDTQQNPTLLPTINVLAEPATRTIHHKETSISSGKHPPKQGKHPPPKKGGFLPTALPQQKISSSWSDRICLHKCSHTIDTKSLSR